MTYDRIDSGGDIMIELGKTYRFEQFGTFVELTFSDESEANYQCKVVDSNHFKFSSYIDKDIAVWKRSKILETWERKEIIIEFDPMIEFKNVRLSYKDSAVIDLWIDMSLQTGDKAWFKLLTKKKREVSA